MANNTLLTPRLIMKETLIFLENRHTEVKSLWAQLTDPPVARDAGGERDETLMDARLAGFADRLTAPNEWEWPEEVAELKKLSRPHLVINRIGDAHRYSELAEPLSCIEEDK
jgi:hypothetical protein